MSVLTLRVIVRFTQWDATARHYIETQRETDIDADPDETVATFADRAHDILMPRGETMKNATPAQFRLNTCRKLCQEHGFLVEHATVGEAIRFNTPLELRPVPLTDA